MLLDRKLPPLLNGCPKRAVTSGELKAWKCSRIDAGEPDPSGIISAEPSGNNRGTSVDIGVPQVVDFGGAGNMSPGTVPVLRPAAVVLRGIRAWIGIHIGRVRILPEAHVPAGELISIVQAVVHFGQQKIAGERGYVIY